MVHFTCLNNCIMTFIDPDYRVQLIPIPLNGRPSSSRSFRYFEDFYRSDHYQFWENNISFSSIMLTDTAEFRGYMHSCYHKRCDNLRPVKDDDLEFLQRTINAVIKTMLDLSEAGKIDNLNAAVSSITYRKTLNQPWCFF